MTQTTEESQVLEAARNAALDIDALAKRVDDVLAEDLYWFPVRHHSPTVARMLDAAIRQRQPKIVFIEGPAEAQAMIEFITDSKTKPPVAIYSSFRLDVPPIPGVPAEEMPAPPRQSVWYPITGYSPEYIAIHGAKEIGAQTIFMDLPHYAETRITPGIPLPALKRRHFDDIGQTSRLYQLLAKAAGYRTWDETWDRLFESPREDKTYEEFRRDVALFCAAVRATTDPAAFEFDGTLPRERHMWQCIQRTLKEQKIKPKDAMVVCGGFHIFLDRADKVPPPELPQGALSVTVAPYSYFRISELSGYGAGNRAPRFYEMCFEHHTAGRGQESVVIDYVVDVIKEARRNGEALSSADAISASQQALMLAAIRGHHVPVLDDIQDALITCCCKGNPKNDATNLLAAIDEINIGSKLGRVTDRIGRLPIINDFYEQLQKHDMERFAAREKVETIALDKRQPVDAARSALLHRLIFLGVEIGQVQRESAPFGQSIFKEHWRLKWSPQIEPALMEKSLHGDTIEAAAMTVLRESLGANAVEAGPACRKLVQAVDMDLPQLVTQADQAAGHAVDHDDRFHSLSDALVSLMLLERFAAYRNLDRARLADLIPRCFGRACFAVPEVCCVPPEQFDEVISGLLALAEPVMQRPDLDADLFAANVQKAAALSNAPFLRGAFLGVLAEMKRIKPDVLSAELLAYARGSVDQQIVAGDFLCGVLKVSRTAIMVGAKSLVAAIDELIKAPTSETFLSMIPRLRAAFEALHERQRDGVANHVAELYGLKESESVRKLMTSVGAASLMAELDGQVATIMEEWIDES